ncbi:hypothetical protein [Methanomethylovorans sp.]|uniref:hypothetical protein n=1 Tax=Methanomethylovorans sp. TaxID=2758717 RepID=UPI00351C9E3C
MPQAERINSYTDIMNRPVYREILDLLRSNEPGKPLTLAEIKEKLFPLQSTHVNYYTETGHPEYTNSKYYPTMKDQGLRGYLNTLAEYKLIKRILDPASGKNVSYRILNNDEFLLFQESQPCMSIDDLLTHAQPENREKLLRGLVKNSDLLGSRGYKLNGHDAPYSTKVILTEKTKKFKEDVVDFLHKTGQNKEVTVIVKYREKGTIQL